MGRRDNANRMNNWDIIHKKGNPAEYEKYRGIMLLNTAYKLLTSKIRNRLEKYS